jgi:uncharacterized hydrophobic protein (TIGR00271 family)
VNEKVVARGRPGRRISKLINRLGAIFFDKGNGRVPVVDVSENLFLKVTNGDNAALIKYGVLLTLSAVIAIGGVMKDSTAIVIGAMIVAPLATPVLGIGLAIVTVRPKRMISSALIIIASVAWVVLISAAIAFLFTSSIDITQNSQVIGRTSPNLIDLLVAIATGLVGAYAVAHKNVSAVLPGVAIAISLLPPLTIIGLCLEGGAWQKSLGALLLFSVNAVAMIVTAFLVFTVAGYFSAARESRDTVKRPLGFVIGLFVLLVIPLGLLSLDAVRSAAVIREANSAAERWLEGTDFRVIDTQYEDNVVRVLISGPGAPPPTADFIQAFTPPFSADLSVIAEVLNAKQITLIE